MLAARRHRQPLERRAVESLEKRQMSEQVGDVLALAGPLARNIAVALMEMQGPDREGDRDALALQRVPDAGVDRVEEAADGSDLPGPDPQPVGDRGIAVAL